MAFPLNSIDICVKFSLYRQVPKTSEERPQQGKKNESYILSRDKDVALLSSYRDDQK